MDGIRDRGTLALPGHFFDFDRNELRTDAGVSIELRPQCLAVLRCLAASAGRLVTKEELIRAVWRDVIVTDDSIVQCIMALRRALGDAAHRIVQTEPKRGYRLSPLTDAARTPYARMEAETTVPQTRFTRAQDGVRLAYSLSGTGAPLVRSGRWMSHLEFEWSCLTQGPLLHQLAARFAFLRYDQRGQGLSDRGVDPGGPETGAGDLKAVVDAAGFSRFTVLAIGSGTPIAVRFARLYPERVERLIVVSGYARGVASRGERSQPKENRDAWRRLIADGWDDENPLARQMATTRHYPGATREQMHSYNEMQRRACSAAGAVAYIAADARTDVSDELEGVRCPTLVVHNPDNANVPFDEGRLLAARIPGARFKTIDSPNNLPLEGEPAFDELVRLIERFAREDAAPRVARDARAALSSDDARSARSCSRRDLRRRRSPSFRP